MWYSILITVLTAYLLGNLNGSVCISQIVAHEDIRSHGSGNAGLTNFFRTYGSWSTLLVLVIDAGKTVLLVEQNAKKALSISDRAYVLETGDITATGKGIELLNNEEVKKAYLGE